MNYKEFFTNIDNETLVKTVIDTSQEINKIRCTPFCTIAQLEELESELMLHRNHLKFMLDELNSRELSPQSLDMLQSVISK